MEKITENVLPVENTKKLGSIKKENQLLSFLANIFFIGLCILVLIPLLAVILSSFRPGQELIRYGMNLKINLSKMTLNNYKFLFNGGPDSVKYFMWFKNSLFLTVITVVSTIFVCYIVAYGLSMYDFKLKNTAFFLVIATMMVPFEILMLPLYQEVIALNLTNTTLGVVLPGLCGASTIFFFRQFMIDLPKSLLDAGRIDGANEYRICFTIILPLCKPAFAAMAILCGMGSWNSMLWPLLIYREASKFTLPIGLNTLLTPYGNNYDLLIAGSCFSILPIFILFICFQRFFIEGLSSGAVKG